MAPTEIDIIMETILDRLDLEKIRALMIINKWYWRGEDQAPSILDLKNTLAELTWNVYNKITEEGTEFIDSSTGGFTVYAFKASGITYFRALFGFSITSFNIN